MAFEDNCADCLTLIASGLFNTSDHMCRGNKRCV